MKPTLLQSNDLLVTTHAIGVNGRTNGINGLGRKVRHLDGEMCTVDVVCGERGASGQLAVSLKIRCSSRSELSTAAISVTPFPAMS